MNRHDALAAVRQAAFELSELQHVGRANIRQFRAANVHIAVAQSQAKALGASSHEIAEASIWNGVEA